MQKIGDSTSTANAAGEYTEGNAGAGVEATLLKAEWLNAIQRELVAIVEAGGLGLDPASDDQVLTALRNLLRESASAYALDTGSANTYLATFAPALTTLTDGMVVRIKAKTANTAACTFKPNALAAKAIVGGAHGALQGGEIVPNGEIWLQYNSSIGAGSWVILASSGGASQAAPATKSQHAAQLQQIGHGQCRISVSSPTSLKLALYGGNNLIINGVPQQIPAAGVSVSNAGLNTATGYYVYAYMNGAVMMLECSTTGHSPHTNGVEIKNGDATRTLVGWTQTGTSSVFAPDSGTTISTMNWFNRRQKTVVTSTVADLIFTNTTMSELSASMRAIAPAWAGDSCISNINGNFLNAVSGSGVNAQLYSGGYAQGTRMSSNLSGDVYCPFNTQASLLAISDGLLNCQLFGFVGSGSGRVVAGAQLLLSSWV